MNRRQRNQTGQDYSGRGFRCPFCVFSSRAHKRLSKHVFRKHLKIPEDIDAWHRENNPNFCPRGCWCADPRIFRYHNWQHFHEHCMALGGLVVHYRAHLLGVD